MEHHGTLWNVMELDGTLWNIMECSRMFWNVMECHGTFWKVQGCVGRSCHKRLKYEENQVTPDITPPLRLIVLNELAFCPIMQAFQL